MDEEKNSDNAEGLKKKVDESWKEAVAKDRLEPPDEIAEMPEITFGLFISSLAMEAVIALGDAEHPITKKKEFNANHAKFIIETLAMLKEKTKGNLSKDEEGVLDSILYDLRMRFVNKAGK
jgi:CRISPR/Cas system endoribonuclease Cas6 (RAMP superfamily)